MSKGTKLNVNDTQITVISENKTDFISLTDMTSGFNEGSGLIGKWITQFSITPNSGELKCSKDCHNKYG